CVYDAVVQEKVRLYLTSEVRDSPVVYESLIWQLHWGRIRRILRTAKVRRVESLEETTVGEILKARRRAGPNDSWICKEYATGYILSARLVRSDGNPSGIQQEAPGDK